MSDNMTPTQIAEAIITEALKFDEGTKRGYLRTPEPLRFLIYETGIVNNPQEIDGTDYYHSIVDELEKIY